MDSAIFDFRKATMNRVSVLLIIMFLSGTVSTAASDRVTLRYSLRKEMMRIVLEAGRDGMVQGARVSSSHTLVKVEFPDDFELSAPDVKGHFEYNRRGRSIFLNIKGLKSVKLLRLKSPPRLVIDAYLEGRPAGPGKETVKGAEEAEPRRRVRISRIVLDPGHGGRDLGIYTNNYSEKNVVLRVARSLRYRLRKKDKRVFLPRLDDRHLSLTERILYARKKSPDLLLSLHMTTSNHVVIYTYPPLKPEGEERYLLERSQAEHAGQSRIIARELGRSIMRNLNINVLYREMDLPILSHMNSPAVLIELPAAEFFNYTRKNIGLLATSITEGLVSYEGR